MSDTALATAISHEIALIKYSRTLGKDASKYIDSIMKALKEELLATDKITTKKQKDELIKFINELFNSELGDWNEELEKDITRLIKEEAKFHQASLSALVGEKVARPTLESITKAAYNTEMVLSGQAYTVDERIKQYDVNSVDKVKRIVTAGWSDGATTYEMMQQIAGKQNSSVSNQMKRGAYTLAKDLTSHVSSVAKTKVGMDNSDVVVGEKHISVLDSKTSPICQRLGSTDGGGKEYYYAEDGYNFKRPPLHWNACVAGTMITTENGLIPIEDVKVGDKVLTHTGRFMPVTTVMCKKNQDSAYMLVDNFGRSVRLTHEHPILTLSDGWKVVGDVKVGDVVFNNSKEFVQIDGFRSSLVENAVLINSYNIKTKATKELVSYGIFSQSAGMSSSVNLKGDIANDEVCDVYSSNHTLKAVVNSDRVKGVNDDLFVFGRVILESGAEASSHLDFSLPIVNGVVSKHSVARLFGESLCSFGILPCPMVTSTRLWCEFLAGINGILSVSGADSKLDASLSDCVVRNAILSLNKSEALSILPVLDSNEFDDGFVANTHFLSPNGLWFNSTIKSIVEYQINDYVYNISVAEDETYIADGILVHNCRSTHRYILAPEYEALEEPRTKPAVVDGKAKRVDSEESWMELAKKNPNLARESLGVERAKVLDAMSPEEFAKIAYNRLDQLITIDELVKKSKKAAAALGRN